MTDERENIYWPTLISGVEPDEENDKKFTFHAGTQVRFKAKNGKWYIRMFRTFREAIWNPDHFDERSFTEFQLMETLNYLNQIVYTFQLFGDKVPTDTHHSNGYKIVDELDSLQISEEERMKQVREQI